MLQNLTKTGHKTEGRTILTRRREEERNLQPWRPQLKRREMNHERRRGVPVDPVARVDEQLRSRQGGKGERARPDGEGRPATASSCWTTAVGGPRACCVVKIP
jgi:hypothetical protein